MKLALAIILLLVPSVAWGLQCEPKSDGTPTCVGMGDTHIEHDDLPYDLPFLCPSGLFFDPESNSCVLSHHKDTSWHLLTVSHSGTVSLVKGLSKGECKKTSDELIYDPRISVKSNSHIDRAECYQ